MNYEKILLELLGRIQVLEDQVSSLIEKDNQAAERADSKVSTDDIRRFIEEIKAKAKDRGERQISLVSGSIHKTLGLKNAMPQVCNAMRQAMADGDVVVRTTPSGNSSTIEIAYAL